MISIDDIVAADRRIKGVSGGVIETPLQLSHALSGSSQGNAYLKCEHLQNTGSFKLRGALNKLCLLDGDTANRGIVAASSGNHGLAISLSAAILKLDAVIYVPESVSPMKADAIKSNGASIVKVDGDGLQAEITARREADSSGRAFVSPYNDLEVIAGQGTIGLELEAHCPELDAVIIAVGGGGLISGVGSWLKTRLPGVEIIGAWPEVACSMLRCLEAGKIIEVDEEKTLSDGTAGGVEPGSVSFPLALETIDSTVLVSESEIAAAMRLIAANERWIVEGAAGVAVAAFLKTAHNYRDKNVAIVVCGRNISLDKFLEAVA